MTSSATSKFSFSPSGDITNWVNIRKEFLKSFPDSDQDLLLKKNQVPPVIWSIIETCFTTGDQKFEVQVIQFGERFFNLVIYLDAGTWYLEAKDTTTISEDLRDIQQEKNEILIASWEIKRLKKQLEQKNEELKQKNSVLKDLAFIASHDLRSPLRTIGYLAEWVEEDSGNLLPEKSLNDLRKIKRKVESAKGIADGILDYARHDGNDSPPELVAWAELTAKIVESIEMPDGYRLSIKESPIILEVKASSLEIVLRNLVQNSVKHRSSDHGSVVVSIEEKDFQYSVSVKDDGPGLSPDSMKKIKSVLKEPNKSSVTQLNGIGLTIVQKVAASAGGSVSVAENSDGPGLTFLVQWPKNTLKKPKSAHLETRV